MSAPRDPVALEEYERIKAQVASLERTIARTGNAYLQNTLRLCIRSYQARLRELESQP